MAKENITGIDIGTYEVKIMISEKNPDGGSALPVALGSGQATSRGLRYGYIINKNDIGKSIADSLRNAEKQAGVKAKRAYLALGGVGLESFTSNGSVIISRADSEITQADVDKCTEAAEENLKSSGNLQNRKVLQSYPILFKIDGKEALGRPLGMRGGRLEAKIIFITCLEQHLNDLIGAVEEAGLIIEDVIPSPIAAAEALLTKPQRLAGCVLANIGAETVSIIVYENDRPISVKVFPIGGSDITNDIALGLQIPLEEAEKVKQGAVTGGSYSKKKLDEIIVARLSDIFELIENHLKKIGKNGLLPAGIILTGGGALIGTIEELAKNSLRLPSQSANLKMLNSVKNSLKDSTWAVAYGLCKIGLSDEAPQIRFGQFRERGRTLAEWLKQFLP